MATHRAGDATRTWRDAAVIATATLLFAFVSVQFELSETIAALTRPRERFQLDELPGILLFMALGLAWFAWRRVQEVRATLQHKIAIEAELTAALADNRRLERATIRIQEDERRNLARELHDELGQYLNAIKVDAVYLRDANPLLAVDAKRCASLMIACSARCTMWSDDCDQRDSTSSDLPRRLKSASTSGVAVCLRSASTAMSHPG